MGSSLCKGAFAVVTLGCAHREDFGGMESLSHEQAGEPQIYMGKSEC